MARKRKSFTLVEVLISILIVAIISAGTYFAFHGLSQETTASRNQLFAVNLAQAYLEEARTKAQSNFDALTPATVFSPVDAVKFPGFSSNVNITILSSELKKADVTIGWPERGINRTYNLSLLLSRPPEPLMANIHGTVTNVNTGVGVNGASVILNYVTDPGLPPPAPKSTNAQGDYTFLDADGNPILKPGDWNLKVTHVSYYDSAVIPVDNLSSGEDRDVDVALNPKPSDGHIKGKFVDANTSQTISGLSVYLYEGAQLKATQGNSFDFTISFTDANPRCFTVNTQNVYIKGYAGNFCGPRGTYNPNGWSSSVVRADSSIICANPWNGNASMDRICVNPGQTIDLGSIPLVPVPTATLTGYVRDGASSAISGATVRTYWHDGNAWKNVTTDAGGFYSVSVPAQQELFADNNNYYLRVNSYGTVVITGCCDTTTTQTVYDPASGYYRVGPLTAGSNLSKDFVLPGGTNKTCGDADGYVKDGKTNAALSAATVSISGSKSTDASGYYQFKCPATAYSIPVGNYSVTATKGGYYQFQSAGNNWYSNRGSISILANQTRTYADIRMWPLCTGTIRGRIVIAGTAPPVPIPGATVQLDAYWNSYDKNTVSDSSGNFTFNSIIESWPSVSAVGDSYYSQTQRTHILNVTYTDQYDPNSITGITLDCGQDRNLGDIGLAPKGQT